MSEHRLIEDALPLKEVSVQGAREKTLRQGNISTLHIWWARKPTVVCRAALLGSLLHSPATKKQRDDLLKFLVEFCTWEASTDEKLIKKSRELISEDNIHGPPKVLDCFAGGGAIPLEALRVGCETYALELNPVAVIIELCTLVYPQKYGKPIEICSRQSDLKGERKRLIDNRLANDVEKWGNWIIEEARKKIGSLYPFGADGEHPVAYLWARTVTCPNPTCRAEVPLLHQLWLARKANRRIALKMIPDQKSRRVMFSIVKSKEIDFDPDVGTMRYGSAECPLCRTTITRDYLKASSQTAKSKERLIAVVTHGAGIGKNYRLPLQLDEDAFQKARDQLELLQGKSTGLSLVPNEIISRDWPRTILLPLYGWMDWGRLFNARQALSLVVFCQEIREVYSKLLAESKDQEYSKAVVTYLALALDRLADKNANIVIYNVAGEKVEHVFGRQAINMAWGYAEVNPFTSVGWPNMLEWIIGAIESCSKSSTTPANVTQGTATELPYHNDFFDAVVTDPPYYSAVPYADLSDFFYVWLKRSIRELYPQLFSTPLTPKTLEIVEQMPHSSLKNRKDKLFFQEHMTKALQEIRRVLKPDGICTIVFAHKTTTAWETLVTALIDAGFVVSASWPLHTEMQARLSARESAALASSVWLVCRKRSPSAGIASWKNVQAELNKKVKERLDFFLSQGIRGADALLSAIGPALEVFGRYQKVEKVTGAAVKTSEFLDKVLEVVAYHALSTVLSEQELGKVDSSTAFYVLWKWTFEPAVQLITSAAAAENDRSEKKSKNGPKALIPFDDALKLARSVGVEIDTILKARLLKQEKEYVRVLGPMERREIHTLGVVARDGTPPTTIDMLHRALILWAEQEHGLLDEYLRSSGAATNETFWRVTQALSNLLPLQSREKQLLDGLLARHAGGVSETDEKRKDKTLYEFIKGDK